MNAFKSAKDRKEFVSQFYWFVADWFKKNSGKKGCGFVVQKARDTACKTHERYVWNIASSTTTEPVWAKVSLSIEFGNEYVPDINTCDSCANRYSGPLRIDEDGNESQPCKHFYCKYHPRFLTDLKDCYKEDKK